MTCPEAWATITPTLRRPTARYRAVISREDIIMQKYVCTVCGYVYDPAAGDPDNGVAPGTAFEALPGEWVCPECGAGKESFEVQ